MSALGGGNNPSSCSLVSLVIAQEIHHQSHPSKLQLPSSSYRIARTRSSGRMEPLQAAAFQFWLPDSTH